jgi:hypothetical protein
MATLQTDSLFCTRQQDKGVFFGSFSNAVTKQTKFEKWKEVTELGESLGLVTGKP